MFAPALALRPPCGRTGSPPRPRHRCISAGGGRGNCAGRRFSVKMTGKAVGRKAVTAGNRRAGDGPEGRHSGETAGVAVSGGGGVKNPAYRGTVAEGKAAVSRSVLSSRKKRAEGRGGGLGEGEHPLAPAATEWRPQAVPVATKEATGIDSRDEGVPPPPETRLFKTHKPYAHGRRCCGGFRRCLRGPYRAAGATVRG